MPAETKRWLDAVGAVVSDPAAAVAQLPGPKVAAHEDIGVVHRRLDDGDVYFVANTGNETRTLRFDGPVEQWDAFTGAAEVTDGAEVTLHPYEATVLVPVGSGVERTSVEEMTVGSAGGAWMVEFGGRTTPVTLPHRWEDDPGRSTYSGSAAYETEIDLPQLDATTRVLLDFGAGHAVPDGTESYLPGNSFRALLVPPIGVAAEVWLNGVRCGVLWGPPYRLDLTHAAKPGPNALRIMVHNTAANALAADEHLAPLVEAVTAQYGRRFDLQDIEHAGDFLDSGLLNPPVVILRHQA
jgi:hypothetical protein